VIAIVGRLFVVHPDGYPPTQVSNPGFGIGFCASVSDGAATTSARRKIRARLFIPPPYVVEK
jgi:drug/metabolite transporter (DMT)-like permease